MYSSVLAVLANLADKPIAEGGPTDPGWVNKDEKWLWMRECTDNLVWTRHRLHNSQHKSDLVFGAHECNKDHEHPYRGVVGRVCLFRASEAYFIETAGEFWVTHPHFPAKLLLWFDNKHDRRVQLGLNVTCVYST